MQDFGCFEGAGSTQNHTSPACASLKRSHPAQPFWRPRERRWRLMLFPRRSPSTPIGDASDTEHLLNPQPAVLVSCESFCNCVSGGTSLPLCSGGRGNFYPETGVNSRWVKGTDDRYILDFLGKSDW